MKETNRNGGGLTFSSALAVAFIVLKLLNVIDWAWVWVLAPLWISLILVVILAAITHAW